MSRHILVVGGAGYIGSHMLKALHQSGYQPITLDDLSTGHRDAVRYGDLVKGCYGDPQLLDHVFGRYRIDAVMHFGASSQVGESMRDPAKYYLNNLVRTQVLLDRMRSHQVNRLIFSSTAAVYGEPQTRILVESHPSNPINPYGRTKWIIEQMLQDYDRAYGLKSISLRYFNAAGADPDGLLGERHEPETHLIPLVIGAAMGTRGPITVFGDDYSTADGTCVRDYIHVQDLCRAHLLSLDRIFGNCESEAFNLGNGKGYSVQEVIDAVSRVTRREVPCIRGSRRAGDPAVLVADASRATRVLGWKPDLGDLTTIIEHAFAWQARCLSATGSMHEQRASG